MISLLLTLFISLFSVGSPINTIDDSKENIIEDYGLQCKGLMHVDYGGSTIYCASNTDLHDNDFIINLYNKLGYNLGTGEYAFDNNFKCSVYTWQNLDMHYFYSSNTTTDIVALSITCQRFSYTENGKLLSYYNVALHNRVNGSLNTWLTFDFAWVYPSSVDNNYNNEGIMIIQYTFEQYFYVYDTDMTTTAHLYFGNVDSTNAYQSGYNDGQAYGEQVGFQKGLDYYLNNYDFDNTAFTIFNGIFDVGLLPINVFLTIFNFELFGVNIAGIVSGLLTLSVVIIILRFLLGGKKDD